MSAHGSFKRMERRDDDITVYDVTDGYSRWGNLLVELRPTFPDIQDLYLQGEPVPIGAATFIFKNHESIGFAMDQLEIMIMREVEAHITKYLKPKEEE